MDDETISNIRHRFRYRSLKLNFIFIFLGIWSLITPYTLGYTSNFVISSDVICGGILIAVGLTLSWARSLTLIGMLVGLWITAVSIFLGGVIQNGQVIYAHDTLLGFAVLAASLSSPSRPQEFDVGPSIPEKFKFNPSSINRRCLILTLTVLSWIESRYLTSVCLGFASLTRGDGSCSPEGFKIQALLSIFFAMFSALTLSGGEKRWHTRPKAVLASAGLLIITTVLTVLPILFSPKPFAIGGGVKELFSPFGCPVCMLMIIKQVLLITVSFDEIKATCLFLSKVPLNKQGTFFHTVFHGSKYYKENVIWEERSSQPLSKAFKTAFQGLSLPFNLLGTILISLVLIELNRILSMQAQLENFLEICSRSILIFSTLAICESLRALRFMNLAFGFGIFVSSVLFGVRSGDPGFSITILSGLAIIVLSLKRHKVEEL